MSRCLQVHPAVFELLTLIDADEPLPHFPELHLAPWLSRAWLHPVAERRSIALSLLAVGLHAHRILPQKSEPLLTQIQGLCEALEAEVPIFSMAGLTAFSVEPPREALAPGVEMRAPRDSMTAGRLLTDRGLDRPTLASVRGRKESQDG